MLTFMQNTRYSCPKLMKLEFSSKIMEKYSNNKFHENLFNGSRVVPCGMTYTQTDRHDEAISRFSQFCVRA